MISRNQFFHLSIYDGLKILKRLSENSLANLLEAEEMRYLKWLSDHYGLIIDLYLQTECGGFSISDISEPLWNEIKNNNNWLKIAWQEPDSTQCKRALKEDAQLFCNTLIDHLGSSCFAKSLFLQNIIGDVGLLDYWNEVGIEYFLVMNSNVFSSILFNENTIRHFQKMNICLLGRHCFRKICLNLSDSSNKSLLETITNISEKWLEGETAYCRIEAFCYEQDLAFLKNTLNSFMDRILETRKPLYLDRALCHGGYVYFSTMNTKLLYKLDVSSGHIVSLIDLPCKTVNKYKYSALYYYEDCVWMIPWAEKEILIYSIIDNSISRLHINCDLIDGGEIGRFKITSMYQGRIYWFFRNVPQMLVIDMQSKRIDLMGAFPEGVVFDKDSTCNVKSIIPYGNTIYFLAGRCNCNLVFDIQERKWTVWNIDTHDKNGNMDETGQVIIAPQKIGDPIVTYCICGELIDTLSVPARINAKYNDNICWQPILVHGFLFFPPRYSDTIICLNSKDRKILFFRCENDRFLDMRREEKLFMDGCNVFFVEEKNEFWATLTGSNLIMMISEDGTRVHYLDLKAKLEDLLVPNRENDCILESKWYGLDRFVTSGKYSEDTPVSI